MTEFNVTRTFHPIGQGAFYLEYFKLGGNDFIVVYDCGSSNSVNPPKSLCKEVRDSFQQSRYDSNGRLIVDILFLSHFHNDHLNEVGLLAPKKVVCPLVSDDDILMFQVFNQFQPEWNTAAMSNPSIIFDNNTNIIRVAPMRSDEDFEGSNRIVAIDELQGQIASSTRIGISSNTIGHNGLWCFIPYNYHYKGRLEVFKEKLKAANLSYEDLKNDPSYFIETHRKTLRKIFNSFTGNTNDQSLLLYSGPTTAVTEFTYLDHDPARCCYCCGILKEICRFYPLYCEIIEDYLITPNICHRLLNSFKNKSSKAASLYYGDITLSEQLISSLTGGLSVHMKNVGTIQLPHHGSDRSFHESVLHYYRNNCKENYEPYSVLFVMCAGTKSKTHPGKNVMTTLSHSNQFHNVVTNQRESAITEKWCLYRKEDTKI